PRDSVTLVSSTRTLPADGTTRLLTVRISVDLPAPERPTTTTNWPRGMESETPFSAFRPVLYVTSTSRNSIWDTHESNPKVLAPRGRTPLPRRRGPGFRWSAPAEQVPA